MGLREGTMLKKMLLYLLFVAVLLLVGCDVYMKQCTYNVYQKGVKLNTEYIVYQRLYEYCKDHSKDGNFYKLTGVKKINLKEIKH